MRHTNTIVGIHNETDTYYVEYGDLYTSNPLGTYDYVSVDNSVDLRFTPNAGIGVTVKVFSEEFKKEKLGMLKLHSPHMDIFVDDFTYVERIQRYRYDFALKHIEINFFEENFITGISTTSDLITFTKEDGTSDDHFFVTGEEVNYSYAGISTERISVMTGTGYTNKLPDSVFVIKKTENTIQLSTSRADAMSGIALTFTDRYEYMEDQTLDAIYPNKKCIILIDGITQSPLSLTRFHNLTNNLLEFLLKYP